MANGVTELIILILFFMFIRRIISTIRNSRSQFPTGGGRPGLPGLPGKPEQLPEFDWDQDETWLGYDWSDEPKPPPAESGPIVIKRPEYTATPAVAQPEAKRRKPTVVTEFITPFSSDLKPADVANGIIWSQILGPRGGLQRNKRR